MGACQTQQNIDINLIINNCQNQTKKRKHNENRDNSINEMNQKGIKTKQFLKIQE